MKKKGIKIVFLLVLGAVVLWGSMFTTDLIRANMDKPPVFARCTAIALDGGSTVYTGLGYKCILYVDMVWIDDTHMQTQVNRVDIGPLSMKFEK